MKSKCGRAEGKEGGYRNDNEGILFRSSYHNWQISHPFKLVEVGPGSLCPSLPTGLPFQKVILLIEIYFLSIEIVFIVILLIIGRGLFFFGN